MNDRCRNTLNTALGIEFTEIGPDFLSATMNVNQNTMQPMGVLNGGASLAMIETLGSMAANLAIDPNIFVAVGQQVSGSHFKAVLKGDVVRAVAKPLHLGKSSHVWEVVLENSNSQLICKGTITMAILPLERIHG